MPQMLRYKKMIEATTTRWFLNFFLAVIVFCNAEMGRQLGIQALPLHISVIWPATGFSLAALLLFGNQMWVGVFVGNFAYNFLHLFLTGTSFMSPFLA
ncbi:MAG TPA: hypothetical protein VN457_03495, partial [Chlamydiales bacterium]|nr:hypothetical protein [Chlamydiales bacterium]